MYVVYENSSLRFTSKGTTLKHGFKNGMLGGFKNGMFVVYIKWYVGGLRKTRLQAEARN